MHFLGLAFYDRTIITEKTGKKNIVTKKDITVNKITEESRKIKFRDDNMAVDSGSRFAEIVPEIDFSSDELIHAITNAIKAEQAKSGKPLETSIAEQEKEEAEKLKKIAKEQDAKQKEKELSSKLKEITDFIKDNKSNMDIIKPILSETKKMGYDNPTKVDKIADANKLLKLIS